MFQAWSYLVNKKLGSAFKDLTFVIGGSVETIQIKKNIESERD